VTPVFDRVAVLGLGLLGGSLARAAMKCRAAGWVGAATRRRSVLEAALDRGFVDAVGAPEDIVREADLVILATPVFAMAEAARKVAPHLREGATLTDVGSVKAVLHETLPGLLPRGARYIGSHPMAGSHERGFEHSRADLFQGAPCIVTETAASPERDRLCDFWEALGARVVVRDPAEHDAEVAWMSHVPHVLAYAFADSLRGAPAAAREVAGAGYRDFTRIARSQPEMWGDIFTANRKALSGPLQAAGDALSRIGRAIEANDSEALERMLTAARETLSRFHQEQEQEQEQEPETEGEEPGDGHPISDEPPARHPGGAEWRGSGGK
jgi:prephenate dehydrogenase